MTDELRRALHQARAAEKEQALFYRALAAAAEERGDAALSERFNELHADEQHHLSRLTARLLELGEPLAELGARGGEGRLETWEADARRREEDEVARYEAPTFARMMFVYGPSTDGHAASDVSYEDLR